MWARLSNTLFINNGNIPPNRKKTKTHHYITSRLEHVQYAKLLRAPDQCIALKAKRPSHHCILNDHFTNHRPSFAAVTKALNSLFLYSVVKGIKRSDIPRPIRSEHRGQSQWAAWVYKRRRHRRSKVKNNNINVCSCSHCVDKKKNIENWTRRQLLGRDEKVLKSNHLTWGHIFK